MKLHRHKRHSLFQLLRINLYHRVLLNHRQLDHKDSYIEIASFPRGDTGYFFNQAYKPEGAINDGGYNNKKVTSLIDELNKTVDRDERNRITNEIIDITSGDIANSYISYNDNIVGMNKDVENLKATPEGIYLIDYKVDIKQ